MPSLNDPRLDVLVSLGNWLRGQDYRFVTVTPATHERVNARPENRMARDLALLELMAPHRHHGPAGLLATRMFSQRWRAAHAQPE